MYVSHVFHGVVYGKQIINTPMPLHIPPPSPPPLFVRTTDFQTFVQCYFKEKKKKKTLIHWPFNRWRDQEKILEENYPHEIATRYIIYNHAFDMLKLIIINEISYEVFFQISSRKKIRYVVSYDKFNVS